MTQVPHVLRFDLRRFRLAIAGWIVLAALVTIAHALTPRAEGTPHYALTYLGSSLTWGAFWLLGAVLLAAVVQTHPTVGTTAFWLTRPIPPRTVLAAKLVLLVGLLVLVPAAFELISMLVHRVPLPRALPVTAESIFLGTGVVLALMCAAAFTPSVARFFVLCAVVILTVVVAGGLYVAALRSAPPEDMFAVLTVSSGSLLDRGLRPDHTQPIIGFALAIVALGLTLVVQYSTRAWRRSVPPLVAGAAVAVLVALVWPWSWFVPRPFPAPWATREDAVVLHAEPLSLTIDGVDFRTTRWWLVQGRGHLSGVDDGWVAFTYLKGATFDVPGDRVMSRPSPQAAELPTTPYGKSPTDDLLRRLLDVDAIVGDRFGASRDATFFVLRDGELPRVQGKYGDYRGDFLVALSHLTIGGVIPVARGATYDDGDLRLTIQETQMYGTTLSLRIVVSDAISMFDRKTRSAYTLMLRNRRVREAIAGPYSQMFFRRAQHWPFGYGITKQTGFSVRSERVSFSRLSMGTNTDLRGDMAEREWLANAELVVMRTFDAVPVTRSLEMRGVTFSRVPDRR